MFSVRKPLTHVRDHVYEQKFCWCLWEFCFYFGMRWLINVDGRTVAPEEQITRTLLKKRRKLFFGVYMRWLEIWGWLFSITLNYSFKLEWLLTGLTPQEIHFVSHLIKLEPPRKCKTFKINQRSWLGSWLVSVFDSIQSYWGISKNNFICN